MKLRETLASDPKNLVAQTDYLIALGRAGRFADCLAVAQLTRHNTDKQSYSISDAVQALIRQLSNTYLVTRMTRRP